MTVSQRVTLRLPKLFFLLPLLSFAGASGCLFPGSAFAWGERGHDLVTRVAVRTLHSQLGHDNGLTPSLINKEHHLSHLSNVPDIVWRNQGDEVKNQNAPTHFIDIEYLDTKPVISNLPKLPGEALKMIAAQCLSQPQDDFCKIVGDSTSGKTGPENNTNAVFDKTGTAPWRIEQLANALEEQWTLLKKLQDGKSDTKSQQAAFDEALKFAGILSHFVGDMAQPLHSSKNYDGWDTGQGGVHWYFESEIVNELPLAFDQEVLDFSLTKRPFSAAMKSIKQGEKLPLTRAWALTLDSWAQLPLLLDLDRRNLIAKSQQTKEGLKLPAKRKPAADSAMVFHSLLVQRIATGADFLANVWLTAWQNAGKPDLNKIVSYTYYYSPEFVPAGYLIH